LEAFVAHRTVERSVWYEGQLTTLYARGEAVDNTCCVWEGNVPEGMGPPPHIHHYEHEVFFVIEGGIRAWVEGDPLDAPKDSLLFIPAGRMHWFVSTAAATRMLSFTIHAGSNPASTNNNYTLFEFIGRPAQALTLPPSAEAEHMPPPAEIARVVRETGSDMPDLERLGWRNGYGDGAGDEDGAADGVGQQEQGRASGISGISANKGTD
jgi:mannose-6-phosphate isomerase-like protein (cupin superfamily)